MNAEQLERFLERIETKNSWGKNELKNLVLSVITERHIDVLDLYAEDFHKTNDWLAIQDSLGLSNAKHIKLEVSAAEVTE